ENKLYRVAVEMTKEDDHLIFDFSTSSPQSPRFINCTIAGLLGAVYCSMFPILAYDLPWNAGVLRPIKVIAPEGLVVNAAWPAPVSLGAVGVIWLSEMICVEALSKLTACSTTMANEAHANPPGAPDIFRVMGMDQFGEFFGGPLLDMGWMGEAAYQHRDGLTSRGAHISSQQFLPNVERIEGSMPLLYLYRQLRPDTGGAGRRRGGQSASNGWAVHDTKAIGVIPGGHGFEMPNSQGRFGGYPGACNQRTLLRNTDIKEWLASGRLPNGIRELAGEEQILAAQPGRLTFGPDDCYEMCPMPGGGWGDPTAREPDLVAEDLVGQVITADVARDLYGVAIGADGSADLAATSELRERIHSQRASWPRGLAWDGPTASLGDVLHPLGEGLEVVRAGDSSVTRCTGCGFILSPGDANWKPYAGKKLASASDLGPFIRLHADLEARQYACPGCGLLLGLEILTADTPPLWDIQLRLG
ncbi:MAG: 5-oxoprolinase, partial [Chloroflexi bacterium]|nr:5-oxoprolinase [Chloroflexota bacterium]